MVDFTNPAARQWIKDLLRVNLVVEGRAGGWMHDFGEYMPFDSVMASGIDPIEYHNQYAADWASVVQELLSEIEGGDDIVYWMRAGTGLSPKNTGIFWMGDQLVSYDKYDGLQSAMIGLLNSGISGFSLGHSDIGGYTAVDSDGMVQYLRDKELLLRWIEMNTFSDPIMRSHPSNIPESNFQIWDDEQTILFMKKFTVIHVTLADYKMQLMKEASVMGRPFTRHPMLHFAEDAKVRALLDEFMLGENILVAPAFAAG